MLQYETGESACGSTVHVYKIEDEIVGKIWETKDYDFQVAFMEGVSRFPLPSQKNLKDAESTLKERIERDTMPKGHKKERDPSELYFSPKTGAIKKRPARSLKMFRQVAELLSKAKTETLIIDCDTVTAHTKSFDLVGLLDFGELNVVVPTKEFLVAANSLEVLEGSQIFPHFEGYSMSITRKGRTVKVPMHPPAPSDVQHPTGLPLEELDVDGVETEGFPVAFFKGGAACATQSKEFPGLDVVVYKGRYLRSTDAKFAFEFELGNLAKRSIVISGEAYRMFRKIDLPVTKVELSELSLTFEFFGGYQLICPQQDETLIPSNASLRFEAVHSMAPVELDSEFWKTLRLLSKSDVVKMTKDGMLISTELGTSSPTGFDPGSSEDLTFCPKLLHKLNNFDGEGVKFGFSTTTKNGQVASFATSLQGRFSIILAGKYRKV